jgi:ABC-type multidrug transport system permease subunit
VRAAFVIGHNGIRLFLKWKSGYVWLFVVPLLFMYFMGVAMRGPGDPANPRPTVLLENRDTNFLGAALVEELGAQSLRVVSNQNRNEASRGIRIPADFTQKVLNRERAKVEFFQLQGSDAEPAFLVELGVFRAVIAINSYLVEAASRPRTNHAVTEADLRAVMKAENPVSLQAKFAGRAPVPAGFNQSLPGNLTQFLMMNLLIFGSVSISAERRNGVLRRLATYPMRKFELVLGKVYGRFLLGCVQIVVFLLLGQFVFRVNIGHNLAAILVTLSLYAWLAASLGVLIGACVTNPDKTIGLCVLASMVMAALGGCWWPLEIVPDTMKVIGHLFPTAWAMDALHQLISLGGGFDTILQQLGVLSLYAVASNVAAAKLLRYA